MRKHVLPLIAAAMFLMLPVADAAGQAFQPFQPRDQQRQQVEDVRVVPPTPSRSEERGKFWSIVAAVLLVAIVFGANAIPSKRGHQD